MRIANVAVRLGLLLGVVPARWEAQQAGDKPKPIVGYTSQFDEAVKMADRAAGVAKGEVLKRAQAWRETFASRKRLRLAWGRTE
jgi:hypothetical protein